MTKTITALVATLFVLGGCTGNGGPSTQQVKNSVRVKVKSKIIKQAKRQAAVDNLTGQNPSMSVPSQKNIHIKNFTIQKSKKLENGNYRVHTKMKVFINNRSTTTKSKTISMTVTMHPGNNGSWVANNLYDK